MSDKILRWPAARYKRDHSWTISALWFHFGVWRDPAISDFQCNCDQVAVSVSTDCCDWFIGVVTQPTITDELLAQYWQYVVTHAEIGTGIVRELCENKCQHLRMIVLWSKPKMSKFGNTWFSKGSVSSKKLIVRLASLAYGCKPKLMRTSSPIDGGFSGFKRAWRNR